MFVSMPWWWHDEDAVADITIDLLCELVDVADLRGREELHEAAYRARIDLYEGRWLDVLQLTWTTSLPVGVLLWMLTSSWRACRNWRCTHIAALSSRAPPSTSSPFESAACTTF